MLFTKPIAEITYDDVVKFCENQISEGFVLDYKREFPSNENLAKIIASFANTYGGVIVIGIDAPKGKPLEPYQGIEFNKDLKYEEKVQSVVLSHIREPVFPEIQVCEPRDNKTFIIIRIPESHLTPHRVGNNRKVYIRTGEFSRPFDEAPWEKIEWLLSRREKSENFRKGIVQESEIFYKESFNRYGIDHSKYFGIVSFRILPTFPQCALIEYRDFDNIEEVIHVSKPGFPEYGLWMESVQNGAQKLLFYKTEHDKKPEQDEPFLFIHLNRFGLYLYKWDAGTLNPIRDKEGALLNTEKGLINIYHIIWYLYQFLTSAQQFYQHLGFWGGLYFEIEFENVLGLNIENPLDRIPTGKEKLNIPRSHMKWSRNLTILELNSKKEELVIDTMSDIAWSIGLRENFENNVRQCLKRNFGS